MKFRLPLLVAVTIALAACGDDKSGNYSGMGDGSGSGLPSSSGGTDVLNPSDSGGGIPPNRPPDNFDPNKDVDSSTLAADTIHFGFDSSNIPGGERGKLQAVSDWLKANPGRSLYLAGHADKRGTPEYNRALGERRALAVREYLVGMGVPATTLFTNSYGADRPAVDGDTEEAFAQNRRVEIGVITKQ
jgi:peptidoglycan-associated lipoprotein